jgi:hypothetical protein
MLTAEDPMDEVIRAYEKLFATCERLKVLSETDEVLLDSLMWTYGTADTVSWQVERLLHSPLWQFAEFRKHPAYMDMLKRYSSEC